MLFDGRDPVRGSTALQYVGSIILVPRLGFGVLELALEVRIR